MKDIQVFVPREVIEQKIYLIRGQKVMLDSDLAQLYGVATFNLNKAVKRNLFWFPEDFMFQLSASEFDSLRFHFGMSKIGRVVDDISHMYLQSKESQCFLRCSKAIVQFL